MIRRHFEDFSQEALKKPHEKTVIHARGESLQTLASQKSVKIRATAALNSLCRDTVILHAQ